MTPIDLPRKVKSLEVDVGEGACLILEPLTDEQVFELMDRADVSAPEGGSDEMEIRMPMSRLADLFARTIRGARGVTIDGEPFDASNQEHLDAIPAPWKFAAVGRVLGYSMAPGRTMAGNSKAPAGPRRGASTRSKA